MNDNGNTKMSASRRPPTALFIWLGIFLVIGLFFLLSDDSAEKTDILTPHEFVTALDNGEIASADVVSGPERFFLIRGKWKKKVDHRVYPRVIFPNRYLKLLGEAHLSRNNANILPLRNDLMRRCVYVPPF